jgi:K+-transporting ATPase c subunit
MKYSIIIIAVTIFISVLSNIIIWGVGNIFWPQNLAGSKMMINNAVRGSYLINQKIYDSKYFVNDGGASGLDPLVEYNDLMVQVPRIAKMRHTTEERVVNILELSRTHSTPYSLSDTYVNTNLANITLDELIPAD